MQIDVPGRIRNVQVPPSKPLLPLFEAIGNSIHAIEDANQKNGKIDIEVFRDPGFLKEESEQYLANVIGFSIRDNGIGFDDKNFQAFITSDTTNKVNRGGKGIGRFMWLAAFNSVRVESTYKDGNNYKERKFDFLPNGDGIFNLQVTNTESTKNETVVKLDGLNEKIQKYCPKKLPSIAEFIIEEFLEYFIGPNCPKMTLRDSLSGEVVSLDEIFDKEMVAKSKIEKLKIGDQNFDLLHVKLYSSHMNEHYLYLCANHRAVKKEKLSGRIPNLSRRLKEDDGNEFVYACYVTSDFLDKSANSERTHFGIASDENDLFAGEITLNTIQNKVIEKSKAYLTEYTEPIAVKKKERVETFIKNDGVIYRPLLNRRLSNEVLDKLDVNSNDNEIDKVLYQAYHEVQVEAREEANQLLQSFPSTEIEKEEYDKKFDECFEKITEINLADLARYVLHRKLVIDFFKKQLGIQSDGKYSPEKRIHDIIFPRGKTSDDVVFEDQNLWLIDERLAFHVFLSSDQPLNKIKPIKNESRKEPDILIFDKATAFSEEASMPFNSVSIIEFKKPMRNEYDQDENPFVQIQDYIDEIKAGKAVKNDGSHFQISDQLPFRCFVICDLTPNIKKWADRSNLQKTPDGLGYFGYQSSYNAYFEVISYQKIVGDAEKRNQMFFKKLGLK